MSQAILGVGQLDKMAVSLDADNVAQYQLRLSEQLLPINHLVGQQVHLRFTGKIYCTHCGRATKKSFSQGYCYPCSQKLAECDLCVMSPARCHYAQGTCRDEAWGDAHCMVDHIVYLANATGPKVGITRATQMPTRWLDQGAVQALPVMRVDTRYISGLVEALGSEVIADKSNWRALITKPVQPIDMLALREELLTHLEPAMNDLQARFGLQALQRIEDVSVQAFNYPVSRYAPKAVTHNFDKTPEITGELLGIKGQYLLLDTGALNIRKFTAYEVEFSA